MSSNFRLYILIALLSVLSICVNGQDLGSSNKLFGGSKSTSGAKTAKKATVKRKQSVSKSATPPKKQSTTSKSIKTGRTPGQNVATSKPKTADAGKPLASKIEITSAKPKETNISVGTAANDLFENLIEDGNSARDERNYSAAEAAYNRAKSVRPKDSRAVYGLGNLYSDLHRWEDAEKAYRTALQIDPKDAVAHIALSYVLTQPIAVPNLSDRYEEAESLARRAIELVPKNSLAFDQLGVALELRGIIGAETDNAYRKSIELDPSFAPAYAHLGRLLRRRGLTKESAAAYQDAVQRSTDVATMIVVADVMQSEQRYAESENLLRKAVNADPKNPSALLLLGRALTAIGNFGDAEGILKRSLDVSPNGFMPNSLLGSLYARQGKFELAENALMQALRSVPNNEKQRLAKQFEAVGDGYLKTGKPRNAERAYRQAVALDADNAVLSGKLAVARGLKGS